MGRRILRWSVLLGLLGYALQRALGLEHGEDPMSRVVLLAALVITPLALSHLPERPDDRRRDILALGQPLGAVAVAVSVSLPVGPVAAALASVWMSVALLGAIIGVTMARRALWARDPVLELGLASGLLMWPVGAAWLVGSRMGLRVMGFDPVITLLTAVHFHYIGLALPIAMALAIRRAPSARRYVARGLRGSLLAVLGAIPIVAAGISLSPVLAALGAAVLAAALMVHAALAMFYVVPALAGLPARMAMVLAMLSPLLSMPLAVAWSLSIAWPELDLPIDLDLMLRLHGQANAHGLVGMSLLSHWLDERARA